MWKQSVLAYIITGTRLHLITSHWDHRMSAIWILRVFSNNPPETCIFYRMWWICQIKVCQFNNHHLQMNEDPSSESDRVLLAGLHFFRGSDANIDVCVKPNPGYSRSLKTRLTVSQTPAEMSWSSLFTIVPIFSESSYWRYFHWSLN